MGANHQKEIEFLTTICEPDLGYITNFGKAHLEGFGGEEGVIKGKSELYTYLKEHHKTALINPEDPIQLKLTSSLNKIVLNNEITIQSIHPFLTLQYHNQEIKTHLVGVYNETNIKAAISIGEYYGITESNITAAIEGYHPTNNRSQLIKKNNNTVLLDAYNANPTSTLVALDNFNSIKHSYKIAILGDMFELGDYAFDEHQKIVTYCKNLDIHRCIFVGKEFYKTNASEKYENFEKLKTEITKSPLKNSYVLIKGSRGMSLERLLEVIN
jgi:UDP-N-acetylmuramoyl-tripeptide--D-alanyl-D-alanine ligase